MILWCYVMIFVSGATGLIYQVTWQKYLSVLLGSHAAASSFILALFFLFLSLGYAMLGRYAHKISKNNLALYAGFEFVIGLYALYSPLIFRGIFEAYGHYANLSGEQDYFYGLIFCALFIFVPTFFMGGTIPVLVEALSSSYHVSSRVHARIYALNTLGAFVGCIFAGFYLIETFGLEDTLLFTGWVNILIGLGAALLIYVTKLRFVGPERGPMPDIVPVEGRWRLTGIALISFMSGFYVFSLEKLTIRMAGLVYGSSAYTYSIVVGAFILAIGIGSYVLSMNEKKLTERLFFWSLILSIVSLFALYLYVPIWPDAALRIRVIFQSSLINFNIYWATILIFSLLIFVVPAGLLGMNLPFLFSLLRKERSQLSNLVGRLYSINCLGAACGAVIGGYWLFKFYGADTIFRISIGILMASSLVAIFALDFVPKKRTQYSAVLALLFVVNLFLPRWDVLKFVPGRHLFTLAPAGESTTSGINTGVTKDDILFAEYDPNTHAAVTKAGDDLVLYVNGKPDAATTGDNLTRGLAALNPIALIPIPVQHIFIAGLGAGLSTAVASKFDEVQRVDVAEISEAVKKSLPYFRKFNFDLDKREYKYNVVIGDAYKVLMSKTNKYELIICEPSNPWVAGVEKLFSTEFYGQVRSHLSEGGVFAQWFPLFGMDERTFLTILKTYSDAFPWVSVWSAGSGALTILGSEKPLVPNFTTLQKKFAEQKSMYEKFGIHDPRTILQAQLLTPAQVKLLVLKVEETQSVFTPTLEFKAGRGQFAGLSVDLTTMLYKKALLPFPKSLQDEALPLWLKQGILPNLESYKDTVKQLAGERSFHFLRLNLGASKMPDIAKKYPKDMEGLRDYDFMLGNETPTPAAVDEKIEDRVAALAYKVRQLQALGYQPKLSKLVTYLEANCKTPEECLRAKFNFVAWFIPPKMWIDEISKFDLKKITDSQKQRIETEYVKAQKTYRELDSF